MTMDSLIISYINTIRALSFWKIMVSNQAVNALNISSFYFILTDRIHKRDISVEFFHTGEMTRTLLIKLNQEYIFKRFRDLIMGVIP